MIRFFENENEKHLRSENYNFSFKKNDGQFFRWGKTLNDSPKSGLPEIVDIEISEVCGGIKGVPCSFCYKSNSSFQGKNMTLETFKQVISVLPESVCQIALGIGDINGNPELKEIILHCKEKGIVPNITINGDNLTDEWVEFFSNHLGAISVSVYDKEISYNAIKRLTDAGMSQVNIHQMVSKETLTRTFEIINDVQYDERLTNMNSLIFLSLKQKGRGKSFKKVTVDEFNSIIQSALENNIRFGFDSCSALKFLNAVREHDQYSQFEMMSEPCESTCFSMYVNVEGHFYPCSFVEGVDEWRTGLDLTKISNVDDFMKKVWFVDKVKQTRNNIIKAIEKNKSCSWFEI